MVLADIGDELLDKVGTGPAKEDRSVSLRFQTRRRKDVHASLLSELLPVRQEPRSGPHPLLNRSQVLELTLLQTAVLVITVHVTRLELLLRRVDLTGDGSRFRTSKVETGRERRVVLRIVVLRVVSGSAGGALCLLAG